MNTAEQIVDMNVSCSDVEAATPSEVRSMHDDAFDAEGASWETVPAVDDQCIARFSDGSGLHFMHRHTEQACCALLDTPEEE